MRQSTVHVHDRAPRTVVVDDNHDAVDLLATLLEANGMEVLTAADGPSGIALIRSQQPDVAVVDLGLPGIDGFGVIETLRMECPDLKTRFVALTGSGDASAVERTKRAGFRSHLVKPAPASAILACLRELVSD